MKEIELAIKLNACFVTKDVEHYNLLIGTFTKKPLSKLTGYESLLWANKIHQQNIDELFTEKLTK